MDIAVVDAGKFQLKKSHNAALSTRKGESIGDFEYRKKATRWEAMQWAIKLGMERQKHISSD